MAGPERREVERIYERQLPGGGFVAIEVTPARDSIGQRSYHGEVVVERRIERERREGHDAPAIAEVDASTVGAILHELFPVAQSNVAVASYFLPQKHLAGR